MADPTKPLRKAVFDKLSAAGLGVPIHSRAEDGMEPPFVLIGEVALPPAITKDQATFDASFEVIAVVEGRSPAPAEDLMAGCFAALSGQALTATGISVTPPALTSSGARSNDEKTLFFGLQNWAATVTSTS
jgi:hypothetical protein